MDPLNLVIILLHPLAAIGVIVWMIRQHRWRQRGKLLKGAGRKEAVKAHERDGERLYLLAWLVVIGGFLSNSIYRIRTEDMSFPEALLPTGAGGLHAGGGVIGLILITILWRKGRKARDLRNSGEPWAEEKRRHGRASDAIMALIVIHAFLGFLWLMQLLI
ncbi:MAG: hypothetical protein VX473_05675 [Candidatus Thermoplasmatota archaeon]|nr:hypothetical protein [Candidatus Thermoplasmatota archaeon]